MEDVGQTLHFPVAAEARGGGWYLIAPHALPDGWRERAVPVFIVQLGDDDVTPLLPPEIDLRSLLDDEEKAVARLSARGVPPHEMSRALHLSRRSVFRRLARLRQLTNSETNAELATKLAKHDL